MKTGEITVEDMAREAVACNRCALGESRHSVVFGEGNPRARIMLIGEAPGAKEDESGRPFVGPAGRILDKVLDEVGISREEIYITGVVKCRPPKNRFPKKDELRACVPFLEKQIEVIKPELIICLGSLATQTLIDPKAKITEIRGKWVEKNGIRIMPTYHPASIFHDQEKLEAIREDFKRLKKEYDEALQS